MKSGEHGGEVRSTDSLPVVVQKSRIMGFKLVSCLCCVCAMTVLVTGQTDAQQIETPPPRRYPDRSSDYRTRSEFDPASAFREQAASSFGYDPYPPERRPYPNSTTTTTRRPISRTTPRSGPSRGTTRDPFNDPNRYRNPQQNDRQDEVRFVNGRPYR